MDTRANCTGWGALKLIGLMCKGCKAGMQPVPFLFNLYAEELTHRIKRVGKGTGVRDEKLRYCYMLTI